MKEPLVSIIVPALNAESTIGACIASVASQTYRNIELIIINDGSSDNTASIIEEVALNLPNISLSTYNTVGIGVSEARNKGLSVAKGKYIAFLDADDTYLPDAIEYLANLMRDDIDITVAQYNELGLPPIVVTAREAVESTLYQRPGFHESPCAKLYRSHLFKSGVRFAPGHRYEDMEMCPDIYMQARNIAISGKKVYNYTNNPDSFINTWTPARLDALWATASITAKWGRYFPGACRNRRFSACFNIFNLACSKKEDGIAAECWSELRRMRGAIICDRNCRIRNRSAALGTFIGSRLTAVIIRCLRLYGK